MEKTGRIVTIILWVLIGISVILSISLVANISENEQDPNMGSWININLIWVYILGIAGAGIAIIFGLLQTLTNKESAKNGLISLVFMGAVALVAFLLASPEIPRFIGVEKYISAGLTEQKIKLVDTGLIATYILFAIAALTIVLGPVIRLVHK